VVRLTLQIVKCFAKKTTEESQEFNKETAMLGWKLLIKLENNVTLASWTTSVGGLTWLDKLAASNFAELTDSSGYPNTYKVSAKHILPFLRSRKLPTYEGQLVLSEHSVREAGSDTELVVNEAALAACSEECLLCVEAWDLS
jgi:hypothetical protein